MSHRVFRLFEHMLVSKPWPRYGDCARVLLGADLSDDLSFTIQWIISFKHRT
jgi:hypothetical protein